jgi:hypothetical protein
MLLHRQTQQAQTQQAQSTRTSSSVCEGAHAGVEAADACGSGWPPPRSQQKSCRAARHRGNVSRRRAPSARQGIEQYAGVLDCCVLLDCDIQLYHRRESIHNGGVGVPLPDYCLLFRCAHVTPNAWRAKLTGACPRMTARLCCCRPGGQWVCRLPVLPCIQYI